MGPGGRPGDGLATLSRRSVLAAGASLCALTVWPEADALVHPGGPGRETVSRSLRHRADPDGIFAVRTSAPLVALTFDDGPDPRYTPAVLDLLKEHRARATFFVVGSNVVAHRDLAERIVREGHRLSNHTLNHLWLDRVDGATLTSQLVGGREAILALDPLGAQSVRPPRGWTSHSVADRTKALGMHSVFWSVGLEGALADGTRRGADEVCDALRPGAILLAHDGGRIAGANAQDIDRSRTVEALPELLGRMRDRGLAGVSLQELLRS